MSKILKNQKAHSKNDGFLKIFWISNISNVLNKN